MKMTFGGWFPERRDDFVTLMRHWRTFDSVSLFYYGATPEGKAARVVPAEEVGMIKWAQAKGIKVYATIGGTPPVLPGAFSGENKARLIRDIVGLCERYGYDGFDIDFEGINNQARESYTEFVAGLAAALKKMARPRLLSVTVQDFPSAEDEASMAFDYGVLAEHADFVRVMCYDYSWNKPGPIMPREWFGRVLDFSRSRIPKEKFIAALPWYGRDWIAADETHQDILFGQKEALTGLAGYQELLSRHGVRPVWDEPGGEYWFKYMRNAKEHTVWFPEHEKFSWMLDEVIKRGAAGIYVWHIAYSDPGSWRVMQEKIGAPVPEFEDSKVVSAFFSDRGKGLRFNDRKGGSISAEIKVDIAGAEFVLVDAQIPAGKRGRLLLERRGTRTRDKSTFCGPWVSGTGEREQYAFALPAFMPVDGAEASGICEVFTSGDAARWRLAIDKGQGKGAAMVFGIGFGVAPGKNEINDLGRSN